MGVSDPAKFSKQPIGILVSRIVDTESLAIELQNLNSQERGILGTAVIRGKLSLLLDIHHVRSSAIETAETTSNDHASVQHQATQATKVATRHAIAGCSLLMTRRFFVRW